MMVCIALVFLQTPAVGITQAGMIRRKNTLSMLMQCFTGMIFGAILWFLFGYSFVFSPTKGLIGGFDHSFFFNVPWDDCVHWAPSIPGTVFATYQMCFAMMVPTLVTGAVAEKMTFISFMMFAIIWPFVVYYPIAHAIWGEGFLSAWGVIDFAGGFVIHETAGVAAFVVSLMVPRRVDVDQIGEQHHNLPLTFVGGSIIWCGWFCFNGGSSFAANEFAGLAVINTQISACFSAVAWVTCSYYETGFFHLVEILNGAFAGLAGVTAAAGYIEPWAAAICGLIAGSFSYMVSRYVKNTIHVDDVLDVTSLQGAPGITGAVFGIGLFAKDSINAAVTEGGGLITGHGTLILKQSLAALFVAVWTAVGTAICMFIVNRYGVPLTEEEYRLGLDITEQGVSGYDGVSSSELLAKFIDFAAKGYIKGLRLILNTGFDVNTSDYDGRTALHLGAGENRLDVVKYLVEQSEAKVNVEDRWGGTPLSDALKAKNLEVADYLRSNGAKIVEKNYSAEMCDAAFRGDLDYVRNLLRNNAEVNTTDYDGRSALHLAAAEGKQSMVQFLIEQGADPNVSDRWGGTPLKEAEANRHQDVVDILVNAGAIVAEKLCRAATIGDLKSMKLLVEAKCDINIGDYDGRTSLHLAAASGHTKIVQYLVKTCKANVDQLDRFNNRAIDDARRHNHYAIVALLNGGAGPHREGSLSVNDAAADSYHSTREVSTETTPLLKKVS